MDYLRYYIGPLMQLIGIAGLLAGGGWVWAGIGTFFSLTFIDPLFGEDERRRTMTSQTMADFPIYLAAFLGLIVYFALAWQAGQGNLSALEVIGMILSAGWLSVVPMVPALHEMYHKRFPLRRFFGVYLQVVYGDASRGLAHMNTHHLHVGTSRDPDSPPRGETAYQFIPRAIIENWREGYALEKASLARRGLSPWSIHGQFPKAILAQLLLSASLGVIGGWQAVAVGLGATALARMWIELFNYFQHYGIVRVDGKPVEKRHVWNHLSTFVRTAGFEITNHADHHLDAYIPYFKLVPDTNGPRMPGFLTCFWASLIPPLWFKYIAQPRLRDWDTRFASPEERALAREANRRAGWPDWFVEKEAKTAAGQAAVVAG
ncbi:MAG: alkane 1-monooxygenase [Candidatus Binatia bacterium]